MLAKVVVIYLVCRLFGSSHNDSVRIASILPQGGEFGFVLFTAAAGAGIFPQATASLLIVVVTLSMALTPAVAALSKYLLREEAEEQLDEDFAGAGADVHDDRLLALRTDRLPDPARRRFERDRDRPFGRPRAPGDALRLPHLFRRRDPQGRAGGRRHPAGEDRRRLHAEEGRDGPRSST